VGSSLHPKVGGVLVATDEGQLSAVAVIEDSVESLL